MFLSECLGLAAHSVRQAHAACYMDVPKVRFGTPEAKARLLVNLEVVSRLRALAGSVASSSFRHAAFSKWAASGLCSVC